MISRRFTGARETVRNLPKEFSVNAFEAEPVS